VNKLRQKLRNAITKEPSLAVPFLRLAINDAVGFDAEVCVCACACELWEVGGGGVGGWWKERKSVVRSWWVVVVLGRADWYSGDVG
jgi:hypothetical protein